jgi:Protein of unknown function (DUF2789)
MDKTFHSMTDLFDQLGLLSSPASIAQFIAENTPLWAGTKRIDQAPFWTAAQSTFIQEKMRDDSDWVVVIESLSARLRQGSKGTM